MEIPCGALECLGRKGGGAGALPVELPPKFVPAETPAERWAVAATASKKLTPSELRARSEASRNSACTAFNADPAAAASHANHVPRMVSRTSELASRDGSAWLAVGNSCTAPSVPSAASRTVEKRFSLSGLWPASETVRARASSLQNPFDSACTLPTVSSTRPMRDPSCFVFRGREYAQPLPAASATSGMVRSVSPARRVARFASTVPGMRPNETFATPTVRSLSPARRVSQFGSTVYGMRPNETFAAPTVRSYSPPRLFSRMTTTVHHASAVGTCSPGSWLALLPLSPTAPHSPVRATWREFSESPKYCQQLVSQIFDTPPASPCSCKVAEDVGPALGRGQHGGTFLACSGQSDDAACSDNRRPCESDKQTPPNSVRSESPLRGVENLGCVENLGGALGDESHVPTVVVPSLNPGLESPTSPQSSDRKARKRLGEDILDPHPPYRENSVSSNPNTLEGSGKNPPSISTPPSAAPAAASTAKIPVANDPALAIAAAMWQTNCFPGSPTNAFTWREGSCVPMSPNMTLNSPGGTSSSVFLRDGVRNRTPSAMMRDNMLGAPTGLGSPKGQPVSMPQFGSGMSSFSARSSTRSIGSPTSDCKARSPNFHIRCSGPPPASSSSGSAWDSMVASLDVVNAGGNSISVPVEIVCPSARSRISTGSNSVCVSGGEFATNGCPSAEAPKADSAKTSPGRRYWQKETKEAKQVVSAPKDNEKLTMECIKIQQKLGNLAKKTTYHL